MEASVYHRRRAMWHKFNRITGETVFVLTILSIPLAWWYYT